MVRDRRSKKQQALSGLIIAGELLTGFVVIVFGIGGISLVFPDGNLAPFRSSFKGWLLLAVIAPVIYATAERWAGFVPGFFLVRGFFAGLFSTIFPVAAVTGKSAPSRTQAIELVAYCVCTFALLWRFIPPRRVQPTTVDRLALTTYAFSVFAMAVFIDQATIVWALLGTLPLLLAFILAQTRRNARSSKQVS